MTTYDFNDQITFVLPDDFTYSVEEDDDGDESTRIKGGRFVDYFGDIQYRQECRVHYQELEYGEARDGLTSDTFLQSVVSRVPGEDAGVRTKTWTPSIDFPGNARENYVRHQKRKFGKEGNISFTFFAGVAFGCQ